MLGSARPCRLAELPSPLGGEALSSPAFPLRVPQPVEYWAISANQERYREVRYDPRPRREHAMRRPDDHMAGLVDPCVPVHAGHLQGPPLLSTCQVGAEKGDYAAGVQ